MICFLRKQTACKLYHIRTLSCALRWDSRNDPGFGGSSAKSIDFAAVFPRVFGAFCTTCRRLWTRPMGGHCLGSMRRNENMRNVFYDASLCPSVLFASKNSPKYLHFISTTQRTPHSTRIHVQKTPKKRCCLHVRVLSRSSTSGASQLYNSPTSLSKNT